MRRWILLALVGLTALLQTGCGGDGVAYTQRERIHRMRRAMEWDAKQYADDVDLFWLNDQNLRTSRWSIP